MADTTILIIEDEAHIAEGLRHNLAGEGYRVEVIGHGPSGLRAMFESKPDLVVLDVMLPQMDGFTICERAREQGFLAPILFLSARATPDERVRGLKLGGDDYLGKPFHLAEFLSRVEALLRRRVAPTPSGLSTLRFGPAGVVIDFEAHQVRFVDGGREDVAQHELAVLRCLWQANGAVVSREMLLEAGWGHGVLPSSRTLDACILRWRQRLESDPLAPGYLVTQPGIGYRLIRPDASGALAPVLEG